MLFFYNQTRKFKSKDEEGKETETEHVVRDCFNINKVVRAYWSNPEQFTVVLDDGHEQAENKQLPIFDNKGNIKSVKIERVREWYCSMINLDKDDADAFMKAYEMMKIVS